MFNLIFLFIFFIACNNGDQDLNEDDNFVNLRQTDRINNNFDFVDNTNINSTEDKLVITKDEHVSDIFNEKAFELIKNFGTPDKDLPLIKNKKINIKNVKTHIEKDIKNKAESLEINTESIKSTDAKKKKKFNKTIEKQIEELRLMKSKAMKILQSKIDKNIKNNKNLRESIVNFEKIEREYIKKLHDPRYNPNLPEIPKNNKKFQTEDKNKTSAQIDFKKIHINLRFEELDNLLSQGCVAFFPATKKDNKIVHSLGTGFADGSKGVSAVHSYIQLKIDELKSKYQEKVKYAIWEKRGDELISPSKGVHQKWAGGQPTKLMIWGANSGNWNLKINEKISGGGQAGCFTHQAIGVFGINTMDLSKDISLEPSQTNHTAKFQLD